MSGALNTNTNDQNVPVGVSLLYMILMIEVIPTVIGMVGDFFCTRFLREDELAVLGLTGSVDTIITAFTAILAIGAQVVCSKDVGAGNRREASLNYTTQMIMAAVVMLSLAAVICILRYPIADLIGAAEGELDLTESTATAIMLFGLAEPGSAFLYILYLLMFMEDKTRRGIIYATVINFLFNLMGEIAVTLIAPTMVAYLICGVIGNWATVLFLIIYKNKKTEFFIFRPGEFSLKRCFRLFSIGLPGGLEYVYAAAFEFVIYHIIISRFSYIYLVVFEIEDDIGVITEVLVISMCTILVDRFGKAYGSGNKQLLHKEVKYSWIICILSAVVIALIMAVCYPLLVDLFMGDNGENTAEIIRHSGIYLICDCIALPFYVANNLFGSIYEVKEMLAHIHLNYFIEMFGFVTLFSIVLSGVFGVTGFWYALPAAEIATFIVNLILVSVHNKRLPKHWSDLEFPNCQAEE